MLGNYEINRYPGGWEWFYQQKGELMDQRAKKREPEINAELAKLETAISSLAKALGDLNSKLKPVMREEDKNLSAEKALCKAPDLIIKTRLGEELRRYSDLINDMITHVHTIMNLVEL